MITSKEHNLTNSKVNRNYVNNLTAYLTEISIVPGQFSDEYIVKALDYNGKQQSGFFNKCGVKLFQDSEKNPSLEVTIVRLESKHNWAFVKPKGGFFLESDEGIHVFASDLVYES